jgi:hypothetical protein
LTSNSLAGNDAERAFTFVFLVRTGMWFPCISFYLMMVHCIWASWRAYEFTSPTTCEPASLRAFRASEKSSTLRAPGLGEDWGGWVNEERRGGLDSLLSKGCFGGMEWNGMDDETRGKDQKT